MSTKKGKELDSLKKIFRNKISPIVKRLKAIKQIKNPYLYLFFLAYYLGLFTFSQFHS